MHQEIESVRVIEMANFENNDRCTGRIEIKDEEAFQGYREIGMFIAEDREAFHEIRERIEDD